MENAINYFYNLNKNYEEMTIEEVEKMFSLYSSDDLRSIAVEEYFKKVRFAV